MDASDRCARTYVISSRERAWLLSDRVKNDDSILVQDRNWRVIIAVLGIMWWINVTAGTMRKLEWPLGSGCAGK